MNRSCRALLAGLTVLVIVLAGCSSSKHQGSPATSTTSAPSAATTSVSTSVSTTSTSATMVPRATQNLLATPQLKAQLLAAFAQAKGNPQTDFQGPASGSVYYAYLGSTDSYWALASFSLAPDAPEQLEVDMQDGGGSGIFTMSSGGSWDVRYQGVPFPCPGDLPSALVTLWGLQYGAGCQIASANSPTHASIRGLPVLTIPSGTYFGTILYFGLQYDGYGDMLFEPETWQGNSPPASHSRQYVDLDWGSSVQTGLWVGSSLASSHEVIGPFDQTFANAVTKAMVPFASEPYSGYVVTVTNPAGCQGSCSMATSIVQYGPDTPTPPNPDFTEPPA